MTDWSEDAANCVESNQCETTFRVDFVCYGLN